MLRDGRVREQARWCRPRLIAKSDPDHDTVCAGIRDQIAASLNSDVADSTRILYGGSVKPENAGTLCKLHDIDGALVGGASLDPNSFAQIVINAGS